MPVDPKAGASRSHRFPRSDRLLGAQDFQAVFDDARRAADALFTVLGRQNGARHARLGLAISMRAAGNAVVRNRIKRAARERFRMLRGELGSVDVIVMAGRGIGNRTQAQMQASLDKLFRSIDRKCARS